MCPFSLEQPSTICPFSHLGCRLQKTSQKICFRLGLPPPPPPVDTCVPNGLLMLRNSLNDFVFEHRSGCCATEAGHAGDMGTIEIWLIGWLIPGLGNISSATLAPEMEESPNARDTVLWPRRGRGLDRDDSRTLCRGGCPVFEDEHRFGRGECSRVFCD